MGIISWIVFGLIAGLVARFLKPGADPAGWIITIIIGIVGAVLGGYLFQTILGDAWVAGWTWRGFVSSVVGAIIVLYIYSFFTKK
ncbi:MAG: GlsB/YeaQ/YmgE family stress response membrane protein [Flavobacteriaceae bacterium]|jgi:uncharacterized membrane protein YeaQ/YmgE (transglycosylase-associated protein family)|nr:GlsB/YeaQ/YmgE family stress response membrane protein [Flavobacteriaceae bacterium]